jgi:hypothetical protein
MARKQSKGKCSYCEKLFAKGGMGKHLAACENREIAAGEVLGQGKPRTTTFYHIQVEGTYLPMYWMHIEIPSDLKLADLDQFLRDIWLECCGHLSAFQIGRQTYQSHPEVARELGDRTMNVQIGDVLEPGMTFGHEYDFGTTTELSLKVVGSRQGQVGGKWVQVMARNEPPEMLCDECGKPATEICPECIYEGKGLLCDACAEKHECGLDFLLPVVNSPRVGECGYTGGLDDG